MDDVALGLSIAAITLSLISLAGLCWAIGEFRGFQRSKYVTMYPNMTDDSDSLIPSDMDDKQVKKVQEQLANTFGVPEDFLMDDI